MKKSTDLAVWWVVWVLAVVWPSSGTAQSNTEAQLLSQPTRYTDVLDAFDGANLFDFRLTLGFRSYSEDGRISREAPREDGARDDGVRNFAETSQTEKRMWMTAEFGVYRDVMVFVSAPFVLEERLDLQPSAESEADPFFAGETQNSRVRDGVPHIDLGVVVGLWNQFRTPGWPTWVLRFETKIATGEARVPCLRGEGCFRGAGRGTVGLSGESRFSYRYRWLEPYMGFAASGEWVTTGAYDFQVDAAEDVSGPPMTASATLGTAFVPWEVRGRFQRLEVDVRAKATYLSSGRNFSVLYDLLGSSGELVSGDGDYGAAFTGMTSVQAHARLSLHGALQIQAARYVQFRLGAGLQAATPHLLTGAQPCDAPADNGCDPDTLNPLYRSEIDRPGQRFRLSHIFGLDLFASASARF